MDRHVWRSWWRLHSGGLTLALGSFLPPEIRNFRLRKAKGLLMQRHAL